MSEEINRQTAEDKSIEANMVQAKKDIPVEIDYDPHILPNDYKFTAEMSEGKWHITMQEDRVIPKKLISGMRLNDTTMFIIQEDPIVSEPIPDPEPSTNV